MEKAVKTHFLRNNMIATIHQPEYLPYIGFFQRLLEADIFVVLDDVGYQKNAFINRNKIKTAQGEQWITIPVKGRSSNLKINEVFIDNQIDWQSRQWKAISINYAKAPYFKKYSQFFEEAFSKKWEKISDLDVYLIEGLIKILGGKTKIVKSSELNVKGKGTERLINICKELSVGVYLSGPGCEGHKVDVGEFEKENIKVKIRDFNNPKYPQLFVDNGFLSYMSIIDLLFNCGPKSLEIIQSSSKT